MFKNKKQKVAQTDIHRDLETESTKWANSVKIKKNKHLIFTGCPIVHVGAKPRFFLKNSYFYKFSSTVI